MFRDPGLYAAVQGPSTVRMDMELKRRRSKIRVDRVVYPGRDRAPPMRKGGRPSRADAFRFVGDRKVSCPEIQSGAIQIETPFAIPDTTQAPFRDGDVLPQDCAATDSDFAHYIRRRFSGCAGSRSLQARHPGKVLIRDRNEL